MKNKIVYSLLTLSILTFACQKDKNEVTEPITENESELITTLKISLFDGNTTHVFQFKDPDGEGGANGVTDTIFLDHNKVYTGSLQFLDESNPSDKKDITLEIKEEAGDHLICYQANTSGLSITTTDKDENEYPIGLETDWSVSTVGAGNLVIRLRHQPGIKNGDCDRGETDIEVAFPVKIQ